MLRRYKAPPESICEFLANAFLKISRVEEGEGQDLAKKLLELYDGPGKRRFHTNAICEAFPWMYQVGLLKYRNFYANKGGNRLMLTRTGTDEDAILALSIRPPVVDGIIRWPEKQEPPAEAPSVEEVKPKKAKKKKQKKKCCDDPRPVRSKKTGKRKCKNCGAKLKAKKKKADA